MIVLPSKVKDLPYLDERKNPSFQQWSLPKQLQRSEPKIFGEKGKKMGLVLRIYYVWHQNMSKKDIYLNHAILPL